MLRAIEEDTGTNNTADYNCLKPANVVTSTSSVEGKELFSKNLREIIGSFTSLS